MDVEGEEPGPATIPYATKEERGMFAFKMGRTAGGGRERLRPRSRLDRYSRQEACGLVLA